jgi:hypothetical protein
MFPIAEFVYVEGSSVSDPLCFVPQNSRHRSHNYTNKVLFHTGSSVWLSLQVPGHLDRKSKCEGALSVLNISEHTSHFE